MSNKKRIRLLEKVEFLQKEIAANKGKLYQAKCEHKLMLTYNDLDKLSKLEETK